MHRTQKRRIERLLVINGFFTPKNDGHCRARSTAKGYSQIPGKNFNENRASVIQDTFFLLILIMTLIYCLDSKQFDIETLEKGDLHDIPAWI